MNLTTLKTNFEEADGLGIIFVILYHYDFSFHEIFSTVLASQKKPYQEQF